MAVSLKQYYRKKWKTSSLLIFCVLCFLPTVFAFGQEADVAPVKRDVNQTKEDVKPGEAEVIPEKARKKRSIGRFDAELGFDHYSFYTRYQIGGKVYSRQGFAITHFPISELKFPLDAFMAYANLSLTFVDRITLRCGVKKNLHNRVGKMEDTDWVPYPGLTTIYSESDARLNWVITDPDLIVRLFTISITRPQKGTIAAFSVRFGVGFAYQYMYYWCSNVEQLRIYDDDEPYGIGPPEVLKIPGKIITYRVDYYLFTMQITPVFRFPIGKGNLEIAVAIRFSPYLKAKDVDDHVLRAKKSKGDTKGSAFMPFLRIQYKFSTGVFIAAKLEYLYLQTRGRQTQSYYLPNPIDKVNIPGWYAELDTRLKSEQLSVSLGVGYSLEF
ncbi:MAG: omptin family outer membrane protease [Spirochaetes bacterium]|nr:omptin family outer membrane protease [Spirochaetota bacterium]